VGTGELPGSFIHSRPDLFGDHVSTVDGESRNHGRFGRRIIAGMAAAVVGIMGSVASGSLESGDSVAHAEGVPFRDVPDAFQTTTGHLNAGDILKITVPAAVGGKTIAGNLTSDRSDADGFVTAYTCGELLPIRSDLNPVRGEVRTNRLIVTANEEGEICLYTLNGTDLIFDADQIINVSPFPNQRTDTRLTGEHLDPGEVLRVTVPQAVGGKVVVGNLTSDRTDADGFITAFACDQPMPLASDLNPRRNAIVTNRFIGQASPDGELCFYSSHGTDLIFDPNGILNDSEALPSQRTDTRQGTHLNAGSILKVTVPEAVGGKTVIGNLTSDRSGNPGFVTVFPCNYPMPEKSDLNPAFGRVTANRLIAAANDDGELCFYTLMDTDLIVDINGLANGTAGFPHFRFDTRDPYTPSPGDGVEIMAVEGTNWVGDEDVTISCVYAPAGGGLWNRYTTIDIHNQQPSVPGTRNYGAAVIMTIENPEFPVGDVQRREVLSSVLADTEGHIGGYSTTYLTGEPSEARAKRLPTVSVEIKLTENVPPGERRQVGTSMLTFEIPECQKI
jgi:hypothetical protein